MFNAAGLDGPARWWTGKVVVDDGDQVHIPLNENASGVNEVLSSDVDVIKAVLYFYDDRHDDSSSIVMDNIDLRLQRSSNGTTWVNVATSLTTDNKERVFFTGLVGGYFWRIQIRGTNVANPNGIPVTWAFLWEDSDRELGDVHECVRTEN